MKYYINSGGAQDFPKIAFTERYVIVCEV